MGSIDKKLTSNLQITVVQFTETVTETSSFRHFLSKLQEGASLCPHKKSPICIATGLETKTSFEQLCISVTFTQVSELSLHPDMLPGSVYIIKLLKITIKMKAGLLMNV